jgi:hypothetical protein
VNVKQPNGETVVSTPYGKYVWDGTMEEVSYKEADKVVPKSSWPLPQGGNNRLVATMMACNEEQKRLRKVGVTLKGAPTDDGLGSTDRPAPDSA